MEDIIQKYKKEKNVKNIAIIITSLALALSLNLFLSNTDSGKYLKSSVLNSSLTNEKKADLYLENDKSTSNNIINLKSFKDIYQVKSMSFSLAYNNDNVILKDKKVFLDDVELTNLVNNDGINTVLLNFKHPINIKSGDKIMNIVLEKKQNQKENLNLNSSNFIDNEDKFYMLSTSGIDF